MPAPVAGPQEAFVATTARLDAVPGAADTREGGGNNCAPPGSSFAMQLLLLLPPPLVPGPAAATTELPCFLLLINLPCDFGMKTVSLLPANSIHQHNTYCLICQTGGACAVAIAHDKTCGSSTTCVGFPLLCITRHARLLANVMYMQGCYEHLHTAGTHQLHQQPLACPR
jgi:hypothetical protein